LRIMTVMRTLQGMTTTELVPQTTPGHDLDTTAPAPDQLATAWLQQAGLSENTRKAYATDVRCYFQWLSSLPAAVHPLAANRLVVDQYARHLEAVGLSRSTRARRLASLSSFYDYCESLDLLLRNPVQRVSRPKVDQDSQTLGPDKRELVDLVDAARQTGPVDFALVALLAGLGLRVSEACSVNIQDFGTQAGEDQLHRTVTVRRKGDKRQTLPLPPRVAAAVDAVKATLPDQDTGPLLRDPRTGQRLTRHQAAYRVRRVTRAAGIDKALTPHGLRHGFVTAALAGGAPLHMVQDAAGHSDPRTTRRYDRQRKALDGHAAYTVDLALAR